MRANICLLCAVDLGYYNAAMLQLVYKAWQIWAAVLRLQSLSVMNGHSIQLSTDGLLLTLIHQQWIKVNGSLAKKHNYVIKNWSFRQTWWHNTFTISQSLWDISQITAEILKTTRVHIIQAISCSFEHIDNTLVHSCNWLCTIVCRFHINCLCLVDQNWFSVK